jgi:CubicO group peptidase (beta-lactamase class C family)
MKMTAFWNLCLISLTMSACTVRPENENSSEPQERSNNTLRGSTKRADFSSAEALIQKTIASGAIPSAAVAVTQNGQIIYEHAFGLADKERHVASSVHTPYALASATKPIVATAVMQLRQRGLIDLSARAQTYAPDWFGASNMRAQWPGVTVQQLLSHTSGLATYARIDWRDQALVPNDLREQFLRYGFPAWKPGTNFEYSNLGYGLLGHIIEARSGKSLADYLRDEIFLPLNMHDAQLEDVSHPPAAAAKKYDASGALLTYNYNDTPGAGNVYASAHDLALFAAFHMGAQVKGANAILDASNRKLMREWSDLNVRYSYYDSARYSLGWYVRTLDQNRPLAWHEGGMPGASAALILLPKRQLAVAVLANATDRNQEVEAIANALLLAVDQDFSAIAFDVTAGFSRFTGQSQFLGHWEGSILIDDHAVPWELDMRPDGGADARFARLSSPKNWAARVSFSALVKGDLLVATIPANLLGDDPAQTTGRYVLLRLIRDGDAMHGAAVAYSSASRLEHLFPFAAQLQRAH